MMVLQALEIVQVLSADGGLYQVTYLTWHVS